MNNKDLIRQYVTTSGLSIPEHQFNQLNNNLKGSYLRKRMQASETNQEYYYLKDYEFLALPVDVRTDYINKLGSNGIYRLLTNSSEPDKLINILLSTEGFINKLDSDGIYYLLQYSSEPDKLINILGQKGIDFINNIASYDIDNLLDNCSEPDKLINILLSTEGFINKLDSDGIKYLLRYSKERVKVINILGQKGIDYINKLDSYDIASLLRFSKEPDKIRAILVKYGKI